MNELAVCLNDSSVKDDSFDSNDSSSTQVRSLASPIILSGTHLRAIKHQQTFSKSLGSPTYFIHAQNLAFNDNKNTF